MTVFITICFKAEHVVGVFIPFSMWAAPGDNDLNFEIKLSDSVLRSVGMRRTLRAISVGLVRQLFFKRLLPNVHLFDVQDFYSCFLKLWYVLNRCSSVSKETKVAWDFKKKPNWATDCFVSEFTHERFFPSFFPFMRHLLPRWCAPFSICSPSEE